MLDKTQTRELVAQNIDKVEISEREREIVKFRWGIDIRTLEETGKEFGLTRERVRQIEAKVLEKLRLIKG